MKTGVAVYSPYQSTVGSPPTHLQGESNPSTSQIAVPGLPVDKHEATVELPPHLGTRCGAAVLGLVSLAGVVRPALAQEVPPPAHDSLSRTMSERSASVELPPSKGSGWYVSAEHTNDSMPNFMGVIPCDQTHGNCSQADDDGWTAGFRGAIVKTDGADQWVTSANWDMVTQRGSYKPLETNYQGLRQDLAEVAVQKNHQQPLAGHEGVTLDYGIGAGLQAIGPMGGLQLQEAMHGAGGIFAGRLDASQGLQTHYTTTDMHVRPVLTGGLALTEALDSHGRYQVKESLQAVVPLGEGVTVGRASVSLEAQPTDWLKLSAGVHVDAANSNYAPLNYMPIDGVRTGFDVRAEYTGFEHVHPYMGFMTGGMRGEPNFYLGVAVPLGGGQAPRLNPLFK